jgi:hypothetical protein
MTFAGELVTEELEYDGGRAGHGVPSARFTLRLGGRLDQERVAARQVLVGAPVTIPVGLDSTARPRTSSPANASAPMPAPSSASGRTASAGRPRQRPQRCRARRRPRRGAVPATGIALTAGPIAGSKTGKHDPPFRGQCPPETRAFPHATAMASPPVYELPEPKHSSWRVWTPVTLTSTVFGLRTLTITVRRVRPSPTSRTPAWNWGGDLAASPIVAWNRRALCSSVYIGKVVGSPTLQ